MTEKICGTFPAHAGNNNGTFTVRDDSITVNYTSAPDIYEINVHYADSTSQSFGTNFGTAPPPGSTEWTVALKSPAKWVQVHSFNDHYGEPSCPVGTQPEPPILNPPVFQWVTGEPVIDCGGMTVTVVSHEEAAGWYWGNDGEQHLGGSFRTGNETSDVRPATPEECPTPPVQTPPAEEPEEIDCPEGTVPGWLDENGNAQGCVNNQPVPGKQLPKETPTDGVSQTVQPVATLADTGTPEAFTALIIGVALVVSGLALYLRRPKR